MLHFSSRFTLKRLYWVDFQHDVEISNAMVAVDINGDGASDLFVGDPMYPYSSEGKGAVHMFWGRPGTRYTGTFAYFDNNSTSGLRGYTLLNTEGSGGTSLGMLGSALSAGDLNGDGRDDVAVSMPGEDPAGWVYVLLGWAKYDPEFPPAQVLELPYVPSTVGDEISITRSKSLILCVKGIV